MFSSKPLNRDIVLAKGNLSNLFCSYLNMFLIAFISRIMTSYSMHSLSKSERGVYSANESFLYTLLMYFCIN